MNVHPPAGVAGGRGEETGMRIAVPKETRPGERRVALAPDSCKKLVQAGYEIAIEAGAGEPAGFPDASYREAGVALEPAPAALLGIAELVLLVRDGHAWMPLATGEWPLHAVMRADGGRDGADAQGGPACDPPLLVCTDAKVADGADGAGGRSAQVAWGAASAGHGAGRAVAVGEKTRGER